MIIEITLIVCGAFCLLLGLFGSILPVLPGPPLSYAGLLLLHFTDRVQFSTAQLVFWLVLVLITLLADYVFPVLGVKQWKGTKWGNIGCIFGAMAGVFLFPPWGIMLGPFLGAVAGELIFARRTTSEALKSGLGALLGFIFGTVLKLSVCGWFVFCFVRALILG
jgi:uncharacterized protein YqgC (DUF456 family)